jgi:hypothetical protein
MIGFYILWGGIILPCVTIGMAGISLSIRCPSTSPAVWRVIREAVMLATLGALMFAAIIGLWSIGR